MKFLTRPCSVARLLALVLIASSMVLVPSAGRAQLLTPIFAGANTQSTNAAAQGYLGIELADVDAGKAQALKLNNTHGAVITLIDHDAPAGKAGLKVNDVVVQLNGQGVDNADQLRRQLKELPAGRRITLEVSRGGALQNFTVELVDRRAMEQSVWHKLGSRDNSVSVPQMGFTGNNTMPGGFHFPSFGSTLKVGALVEPLTSQMAAHLGVDSGLMVKEVARKSAAAAAGLRVFDVILKVGVDAIATSADWDRALRSNQGKPVQVTILRDRKQQTLTMQVDSKQHQSGQICPLSPGDEEMLAELGAGLSQQLTEQFAAQVEAMRAQAQALRNEMQEQFGLSRDQADELRKQTEKLRESMKDFKVDPKQMDELKRQMQEFQKNFNGQFQLDPKQMEEFRQRMDEFRREMQEWNARAEGRFV